MNRDSNKETDMNNAKVNKDEPDVEFVNSDRPINEDTIRDVLNDKSLATVTPLDSQFEAFEKFRKMAEYFATSDFYSKGFEAKDSKNNIITDEQGKAIVNPADIGACLMIGNELGLGIAGSLLYGNKLNRNSYHAILKGKALGLDISFALEKIHSIPTKAGNITYTSAEIISAVCNQHNVDIDWVFDCSPFYRFSLIIYDEAGKATGSLPLEFEEVIDMYGNVNPDFFLVTPATKKEETAKAKGEGKLIITREEIGKITRAIVTRVYPDGHKKKTISQFTTVDAENAGLIKYDPVNKRPVAGEGKDNWLYLADMLKNRTVTRFKHAVADLLNGLTTKDEAIQIAQIIESK